MISPEKGEKPKNSGSGRWGRGDPQWRWKVERRILRYFKWFGSCWTWSSINRNFNEYSFRLCHRTRNPWPMPGVGQNLVKWMGKDCKIETWLLTLSVSNTIWYERLGGASQQNRLHFVIQKSQYPYILLLWKGASDDVQFLMGWKHFSNLNNWNNHFNQKLLISNTSRMRGSSISICLILWAMLVASSPGRKAGDGIATTAASQTAPSNDFNSRVPVVHELFLPSLKQHDTPKCSERRQLNSRAKGQKGNRNSDEVKQSKADKLIMNQKLQASNRNVILGWNLGYMEFWDSCPGCLVFRYLAWFWEVCGINTGRPT